MMTRRLIEIEFATLTATVEAANRAVSKLADHLELTEYRVEPLVRVDERLVNPWEDESAQPQASPKRKLRTKNHVSTTSSRKYIKKRSRPPK